MARLALINPLISRTRRYGNLAPAGSYAAPLGLCYLAAAAREAGLEVRIFDLAASEEVAPRLIEELIAWKPDVVGMSATTMIVQSAADLARELKQRINVWTVLGGVHITASPFETMKRFPEFDVGVLTEGEITTPELVRALVNGTPLEEVLGIIYRRPDGEITVTPVRPYVMDLDELPMPAWDLLDGFPKRYRPQLQSVRRLPSASIITSRGCPCQCSFCDRGVTGKKTRYHSPDYVIRLISDLYHTYGVRNIQFEDDILPMNKPRLREICRLLKESGMDITWSCLARVDTVDEEVLTTMRDAGCWCVMFGIESGHQDILSLIDKRTTLDKIRKAITTCHQVGIAPKGFFMVGAPGETHETMKATEEFMLSLPLADVGITAFTPFPGTKVHLELDQWGTLKGDWEDMNCYNIVFSPHGMTEADIKKAIRRMYHRFYFRPRVISGYLRRVSGLEHFMQLSASALALLKL